MEKVVIDDVQLNVSLLRHLALRLPDNEPVSFNEAVAAPGLVLGQRP